MQATLRREPEPNTYIYNLTIDGKRHEIWSGGNKIRYIRVDGKRVYVMFNEYVFQDFAEIPMTWDGIHECWVTLHQYEQQPTPDRYGANAPYVIVDEHGI